MIKWRFKNDYPKRNFRRPWKILQYRMNVQPPAPFQGIVLKLERDWIRKHIKLYIYKKKLLKAGDLLSITNHIKRLISNGYPNDVCFNKGIRIKLTFQRYLVQEPLTDTAIKSQGYCWHWNPNIFKSTSIRIVTMHKSHAPKVQVTISSFLPQNYNDLIWNWKVLKRPKNQGFYRDCRKIPNVAFCLFSLVAISATYETWKASKYWFLGFFDSLITIPKKFQSVVSV